MPQEEKKPVVSYAGIQKTQNTITTAVENNCLNMGCPLTDYGKECVVSAVQGVVSYLASTKVYDEQERKWRPRNLTDIDYGQFLLSLQSIGMLGLNYGAYPSEIYFDLRGKVLTIKPQGAGVEKLVREYGVGIAKDGLGNAWLVHRGDKFELPSYDGLKATNPQWKLVNLSGPVEFVVYPLTKKDGSVEWLMADRNGVKPNIVAQIRQNSLHAFKTKDGKDDDVAARDKFYNQLNKDAESLSVDELLDKAEYQAYINPTYTSVGSREQMIIRKMKNNALKNYPREFNAFQKDAVREIYEDRDESLEQKPIIRDADVVEQVEKEINEPHSDTGMKDVAVNEDGEVIKDTPKVKEKVEEPKKPSELESDVSRLEKDFARMDSDKVAKNTFKPSDKKDYDADSMFGD